MHFECLFLCPEMTRLGATLNQICFQIIQHFPPHITSRTFCIFWFSFKFEAFHVSDKLDAFEGHHLIALVYFSKTINHYFRRHFCSLFFVYNLVWYESQKKSELKFTFCRIKKIIKRRILSVKIRGTDEKIIKR